MNVIDKLAKTIIDSIEIKEKKKTSAYDTTAKVVKVEGSTAWVHIPDGVDETPVKMTIKAKAGDTVQVRVSGGKAFIVGNATAPPTDDTKATNAMNVAASAETESKVAGKTASDAQQMATSAQEAAGVAWRWADEAHTAAEEAQASADEAERQAISATNSANSALIQLSTVEDVVDTLNWITNHGTMTSQAGQTFDPLKVYFVADAGGDYVVGGTHYSLVTDPVAEDIDSYYCLTIDEAVANYVASHLSLTNEGLYVLKDGSGYKVLVANTGVFLQNPSGATVASYGETAVTGRDAVGYSRTEVSGSGLRIMHKVTQFQTPTDIVLADIGYGSGAAESGTDSAPYASFGVRDPRDPGNYSLMGGYHTYASGYCSQAFGNGSTASGPYSHAEGISSTASGDASHAEGGSTASGANAHSEGTFTTASGDRSHAEGYNTTADGTDSHSEGNGTSASGNYSHAHGWGTIASSVAQTAIGRYNKEHSGTTVGTPVFIIGNGSSSNRSDALTVDWSGNVDIASGAKYKINGTDLSASDVSAVALSDKYTRSSTGDLNWSSTTEGDAKVIAKSALAFWNGAYSGNSSNLSKCSTGNIIGSNGGTMTGQLKTSFNSSVATGSYGSSQTTVEGLADEVRFSSGCCGSASIGTAYTKNGVTIKTGWYNFLWIPHRSGGINGSASGDNCNYGQLLMCGMNNANGRFILRVSSANIQEVAQLITTVEEKDYVIETGTTNGWNYQKYKSGWIDAYRLYTGNLSNYATSNGFYAYSVSFTPPFTMANTAYSVSAEWYIGSGFAMPATTLNKSTTGFTVYALASQSGTQSVNLWVHLVGHVA